MEHTLMTVTQFAREWYQTDTPTKSQENMVRRRCANGQIEGAIQLGKSWRIDFDRAIGRYTGKPRG